MIYYTEDINKKYYRRKRQFKEYRKKKLENNLYSLE